MDERDLKPKPKRKADPKLFVPPPGLRRKISWGRCGKCGVLIGTGLDLDVLALTAKVDATPISGFGEAQILRLSMHVGTYDVEERRLYRRDEWARRARPAGARWLVVADHWCGIEWPETWRQRERISLVRPYPNYAEPPF